MTRIKPTQRRFCVCVCDSPERLPWPLFALSGGWTGALSPSSGEEAARAGLCDGEHLDLSLTLLDVAAAQTQ